MGESEWAEFIRAREPELVLLELIRPGRLEVFNETGRSESRDSSPCCRGSPVNAHPVVTQ